MEKRIEGLVDDKCVYVEEMPNGGKMECSYSQEQREIVAQYYRDSANAEEFGVEMEISIGSGNEDEVTYTLDGKEVANPLQECMDNGTCNISGYE